MLAVSGGCTNFFLGNERGNGLWAGAHRFWRVILGGELSALSLGLGNRGRWAVGGKVGGGGLCRLRAILSSGWYSIGRAAV